VRRETEYRSEHLLGAKNFPLDFIYLNINKLDPKKTYYLHCAGGYRSMIAASILKAKGFRHIINIRGGYRALAKTHLQHSAHLELKSEL
jgi:rhodanese-related sulfurtransferase